MNGIEYLADTNAIIYLLSGNECMKPYLRKKLAVSVISFMELLSFPSITDEEEKTIRLFLDKCDVLPIDERTREQTIQVRKKQKVRLPDAIIAATAMTRNLSLITADTGFFKLEGLQVEKLEP